MTTIRECSTDFGRFKVKIEPNNVFVGGKTYCVNMAFDSDVTWLNWLSTDQGGCELDEKVIKKELTVKMVDLAFNILRDTFPDRKIVTLLDASGFSWDGPRQSKYKVNFLNGYVLFYRKTWYEEKFGATMIDPERYDTYREQVAIGFDDPTRKPEVFSFGRATYLQPLYQESSTWGEFIEKIKKKYPDDKFKHVLDWYRQAIYHILDKREIDQTWVIDLTQRPNYSCKWKGGSRKTLKANRRNKKYYLLQPFYEDRNWALKDNQEYYD